MDVASDCISCKGRHPQKYCGRAFCPIIKKSESMFAVKKLMPDKDFFGESPSPFVGRHGYPYVNVGMLTPAVAADDVWKYDAPRFWAQKGYSIPQVMDFRSSLVNSRFRSGVMETSRLVQISQEIGMASKPVEIEINLKDKPRFRINNDSFMAPTGPNAELIKASVTSNPRIDTRVERVVSDTDMKSKDGMLSLYKKGFDENFISKILSVGTLGIGSKRRLVPTRWSITAADDQLGADIIDRIRDYPQADHSAYFGSYLGNYFLVMMFPDCWSYELFETYMPNASWNQSSGLQYTTDYESFAGRKSYAYNCAGGYYAARLPIVENLDSVRRQASVLVIRVITGEYAMPLGVWVVREAVRKAMESSPIEFGSRDLMLIYAKNLLNRKFGIDSDIMIKKSRIMESLTTQSKITQFF